MSLLTTPVGANVPGVHPVGDGWWVVPEPLHDALVRKAYLNRGFDEDEAADAARLCSMAARHGIRTHNAIKALHLDDLFGSRAGGCVPGAKIERVGRKFKAAEVWNANKKLGPAVAFAAMRRCMELADEFGVGMVSVDNAFHYLWGGGYVMEAAKQGYIAYTNCTALLAEVVPYGGRTNTLGTNPHSWGFPTVDAVGFPIVVDWATSVVSMGKVQQLKREGKLLPGGCAVDADGNSTTDPEKVAGLLSFGDHKGYGLGLIDEIFAGFIGGSLPTVRGRFPENGDRRTTCFFFLAIHPDALSAGSFPGGRSQQDNLREILRDVLGHGNEGCLLPGQVEAEAAKRCDLHGGLLFLKSEIEAFNRMAEACCERTWT